MLVTLAAIVWPVPFGFFVAVASNDIVLPAYGSKPSAMPPSSAGHHAASSAVPSGADSLSHLWGRRQQAHQKDSSNFWDQNGHSDKQQQKSGRSRLLYYLGKFRLRGEGAPGLPVSGGRGSGSLGRTKLL
eukprot:jgi/Chrzof1/2459/Cz11g16160.t1